MSNLLLHFPDEFTPNKSQKTILKKIESSFANGKKFVVCNAPTGCLTGDTVIMLNRSGNGERMTLFKAYCKTHGNPTPIQPGYCGCGCGNTVSDKRSKCIRGHHSHHIKWKQGLPKIRSLLGDTLGSQPILDIVYSGKKDVYELTLSNGMTLKGTDCHPILTTNGYIPLGKLVNTDIVLTDPLWKTEKKVVYKKSKMHDSHINGLKYHPHARLVKTKKYKDGFTQRVPTHVFILESSINNLTIEELKIRCKSGDVDGLTFINPRLNAVHHKDNNHYNNEISNLQLMTHHEHLKHHGINNITNFGYFTPTQTLMVDRKYIGIEDTFDVQCPDPHHNFVANGIIVHNSGKSFIPITLANSVNEPSENFKSCVDNYSIFGEDGPTIMENEDLFGCYALTITKSLQDQYKNTFDHTGILKGQSNYQCKVDESVSVDIAPCLYSKGLKAECWKACKCPYYNERNNMLKSKFSALNYSMFFSLPEHLKKRKIIVCDEGSELEEQLVNQFTCEVDIPFLVKIKVELNSFPVEEKPLKVLDWVSKTLKSVAASIDEYVDILKNLKKDSLDFAKRKTEYTKLVNLKGKLEILTNTFYDSQYIIEKIDKKIKFIPLKVDKLANYLFEHADHVVIMSATIIDHPSFCKNLGITDYDYIETESTFDSEKAPIYILASQKINFKNMTEMLPKLAKQTQGILNEHEGDKGIIHTHTQFITDYIRNNVGGERLLCREAGIRNEELLEIHEESKQPTVLVSPSMTYGVDLKGDLAKFQIMLKAPWLPTKEARVEKLMKIDKDWYANKMLCTLVQACGRGIRSESDECVTYILDGSIFDAIHRNKSKLPKFFLDRIQ
jgi:uncharacterized protein (DUF488 family)